MTTLQDIMGLITKRKIKTPSDKDYIISAGYTDAQEVLKPQPKMEASLLSLAAIKKYVAPTPAYKVYTALVTQTGTNAPVATVLENTIGNIWFTYDGVGSYRINSNSLFTANKTATFISSLDGGSGSGGGSPLGGGTSIVVLDSYNLNFFVIDTVGNATNSFLSGYPIEIRVYN